MSTKDGTREDVALAPPAMVKAMIDVTRMLSNIERDIILLRQRIDNGDSPSKMLAPVLSAALFNAEMMQHLVRMQIALADEEGQ